jgi:hypothetical protein
MRFQGYLSKHGILWNCRLNLLARRFVYRNRNNIPTSGRNEIWRVENWLMRNEMKVRVPASMVHVALLLLLVAAPLLRAQTPARLLGTITAINGDTITVKADADGDHQVQVPSTAAIKRIAPGQKDLSAAESMPYNDLATGDRVLVKLDADAPGPISQALQIVAVKQADVVLKQEKDREDWQRRGVGGLVKSVDSASGVIVLTSGSGATAKAITVHTAKTTLLKRYAPASVRFDTAQAAPIEAIHAGDQLRARGNKNAQGTEIAAEEAISGSFRNFAGCGRFNAGGERSGHQETDHHSHHGRSADAPPARHDGADDGSTAEGTDWRASWSQDAPESRTLRRGALRRWPGQRRRPAADAQPGSGHSTRRSEKRRRGHGGFNRRDNRSDGDIAAGWR